MISAVDSRLLIVTFKFEYAPAARWLKKNGPLHFAAQLLAIRNVKLHQVSAYTLGNQA